MLGRKELTLHTLTLIFRFSIISFYISCGTDLQGELFDKRNLLKIVVISYILITLHLIQGWYCKEESEANRS